MRAYPKEKTCMVAAPPSLQKRKRMLILVEYKRSGYGIVPVFEQGRGEDSGRPSGENGGEGYEVARGERDKTHRFYLIQMI